uniref:Uncharacterized protein n=1 Tax=Neobodo designis TaxID=312471 RepID=A0A7S1LEQ0_NEODS|mmetsp:Transcript_20482/g.63716  ORF Transcript_20482/g.63716 Transcript_20482/m.63716 type:complete len:184 (+) Transcript_20482:25-576(+)
MSDALLDRQAARQRQPELTAAKRSAKAKKASAAAESSKAGSSRAHREEDGTFDADAVANPLSKASVIVDDAIARKVARARAALDTKKNIDAHLERHARGVMPQAYAREMKRATAVAQRVYNKGSIRDMKKSRSGQPAKLRIPAEQRKAAALRKTRKNNRRQSVGSDPRGKAGKKKAQSGKKRK